MTKAAPLQGLVPALLNQFWCLVLQRLQQCYRGLGKITSQRNVTVLSVIWIKHRNVSVAQA